MPWPMTDREIVVEIASWVSPIEEELYFTFNSVNTKNWLAKKIPRNSKLIPLIFKDSFGLIKPTGANSCVFKYIVNANP